MKDLDKKVRICVIGIIIIIGISIGLLYNFYSENDSAEDYMDSKILDVEVPERVYSNDFFRVDVRIKASAEELYLLSTGLSTGSGRDKVQEPNKQELVSLNKGETKDTTFIFETIDHKEVSNDFFEGSGKISISLNKADPESPEEIIDGYGFGFLIDSADEKFVFEIKD